MADNKFNVEIHKLAPSAVIELFELHVVNSETVYRFHAGTNKLRQKVVWAGNEYNFLGGEFTGMEIQGNGPQASPRLRLANPSGYISLLCRQHDNFALCPFYRIRTFQRFLDAVNFPGGLNPEADPTQKFPTEMFRVEAKTSDNREAVEFALSTPYDAEGIQLPRRRVVANMCAWKYRGPDCGYTGTNYFLADDTSTTEESLDRCGKRVASCICRWGNQPLPFGNFPASDRLSR